jgi:hypothetical protein
MPEETERTHRSSPPDTGAAELRACVVLLHDAQTRSQTAMLSLFDDIENLFQKADAMGTALSKNVRSVKTKQKAHGKKG